MRVIVVDDHKPENLELPFPYKVGDVVNVSELTPFQFLDVSKYGFNPDLFCTIDEYMIPCGFRYACFLKTRFVPYDPTQEDIAEFERSERKQYVQVFGRVPLFFETWNVKLKPKQ